MKFLRSSKKIIAEFVNIAKKIYLCAVKLPTKETDGTDKKIKSVRKTTLSSLESGQFYSYGQQAMTLTPSIDSIYHDFQVMIRTS